MRAILERYLEHTIGVNYKKPFHVDAATLTHVADTYFSVLGHGDQTIHSFPYSNVVQILECETGVTVGGFFRHKETFPVVVKVGHTIDPTPIA